MAFLRAMPVLNVASIDRSLAFYRDQLGFQGHGVWGDPPAFTIVQRGNVTIALDTHGGGRPAGGGWTAYLYVSDADALADELRSKGVALASEPEDKPWNCREFEVRDPDGHLIGFGQDLVPEPNGPGLGTERGLG